MAQGVINRLATQAASCKTWCLTLVGALLSFAAASKTPAIVMLAVLPVVVLAMVDAFYLACERAYRALWNNKVAKLRDGTYAADDLFDLTAPVSVANWARALFSVSIWPVYVAMLLAGVLVLVFLPQA